ncbi:MAG: Unknown protein [uncultured Sulfurovum sp.]|uniref:Uncharacterized protein n=1 Tax=uncultured Sulfurovum sp. TaxID=269237 RepID=A0A6S6TYH3_9BACT|nr:MAG: Unknown protein [uncultured Sulfurovum sp.]
MLNNIYFNKTESDKKITKSLKFLFTLTLGIVSLSSV